MHLALNGDILQRYRAPSSTLEVASVSINDVTTRIQDATSFRRIYPEAGIFAWSLLFYLPIISSGLLVESILHLWRIMKECERKLKAK